jgi:mRNA interferase HigB
VHVVNRSTIRTFADAHADARRVIFAWFAEVESASWRGPEDIKIRYPSASLVAGNRIAFNIKGNKYRVVVAVKYEFLAAYIRFIGVRRNRRLHHLGTRTWTSSGSAALATTSPR